MLDRLEMGNTGGVEQKVSLSRELICIWSLEFLNEGSPISIISESDRMLSLSREITLSLYTYLHFMMKCMIPCAS